MPPRSSRSAVFVIAEIGTSHGGDLRRARSLVDAAARAGADSVKTQIVYADEIVHPRTGLVDLPRGPVPLYDRFRSLEVAPEFFAELAEYTRSAGLLFFASVFGERSLDELAELGAETVKIASPELNHAPLLHSVRDRSLEVILSTGVSTLADIERGLEAAGSTKATLLHCVTAYPAPEEEYNLRVIPNLASVTGVPVGVSDHSTDPELVPAAATALGAPIIEKHLTLGRGDGGLDDPIALPPEGFARMVEAIRAAETRSAEETFAGLADRYGVGRLEAVLGDGAKRLARSEAANYGRSNRSILATRDIAAGDPVGPHNAAILRSEKNLPPGLSPFLWDEIRGAQTVRPISDGSGIRFEDLLRRPSSGRK